MNDANIWILVSWIRHPNAAVRQPMPHMRTDRSATVFAAVSCTDTAWQHCAAAALELRLPGDLSEVAGSACSRCQ
jgi:hypothetical protein